MTSLRDGPARTLPEQVLAHPSHGPESRRYRWWRWLVTAIAAAVIAGGTWWILDSTVAVDDYDDAVAALDATTTELASTQEALLAEQSSTAALDYELGATKQALAYLLDALLEEAPAPEVLDPELLARFEQAEAAALLLGYFAGVDAEIVDPERYETWSGVVTLDMAVAAIADPMLTELYWEHMGEGGFSPGSEELLLRLIELTIEPILQ